MQEFTLQIPFEEGYIGCQCPNEDCKGVFKQRLGTGVENNPTCRCPYCGHEAQGQDFLDSDVQEYVTAHALRHVYGWLFDELKKSEFDVPPRGPFGIGFSMKVKGEAPQIGHYRAKEFETDVTCDNCTLQYAIYGVFAYCPDCGVHNSRQILDKNLELAEKQVIFALTIEGELASRLVEDALENEVAAFDGFGRETCRVWATRATKPDKAVNMSFQNLIGAQKRGLDLFRFDLADGVTPDEWIYACRSFQKRHLLAHKMGVIDEDYARLASDPNAVVGRKIAIGADEVATLAGVLRKLGAYLVQQLTLPTEPATGEGSA